eukprot:2074971-Alexandrium_andersonii.AAC.1
MAPPARAEGEGAPHRSVTSSLPIERRMQGGCPRRALKGLYGWGLASIRSISAMGGQPVLRLTPNCYDSTDFT